LSEIFVDKNESCLQNGWMVTSLSDSAYQQIRLGILRGDFPPGTPLREVQLAKELGVSRGPIREAFQKLEDDGLVDQIPNRGAFARVPTPEEFEDLIDVRIALEQVALTKACARITRPQLAKMREAVLDMCRVTQLLGKAQDEAERERLYTQWAIGDVMFHRLIYAGAHNPMLGRLVGRTHVLNRLWAHAGLVMKQMAHKAAREGTRDHVRIYRAIKADQPRLACSILVKHIQNARETRKGLDLKGCPALPAAMAKAIVDMESAL
jgi:DNA-binding GntR family transcriptional regulator